MSGRTVDFSHLVFETSDSRPKHPRAGVADGFQASELLRSRGRRFIALFEGLPVCDTHSVLFTPGSPKNYRSESRAIELPVGYGFRASLFHQVAFAAKLYH